MKKAFFFIFSLLILTHAGFANEKTDLALGFKYLNEGNAKSAQEYFTQSIISGDAELVDYAFFGLGRAQFELGEFDSAAGDFKTIIDRYNDSVLLEDSTYYFAKCFKEVKKYQDALKQIDNYQKDFGDGSHAAELSYDKGEILEAQNDFRLAYRAYNDVDLFYPLTDYSKKAILKMKGLSKLHKFAQYYPNPKKLFAKGQEYFENGDYAIAAGLFGRLASEYPKHKLTAKAFLMLGRAELENGESDSSIQDIEKSYKLSSGTEQGRSLYYLGRAYGRRGRYAKAISIMTKVASKYPDSNYVDDALYYLALYYEKTDSPNAALSSYVLLIAKHPNSLHISDAILKAGHLYYAKGDLQNAFKIYSLSKSYREGDQTPQCLFLWGLTAEKMGQTDNAAGIYYFLADKYDHTYQSYRAKEKLGKLGYMKPKEKLSLTNAFSSSEMDEANVEQVMQKWQETNPKLISSSGVSKRLTRYKKLMNDGLVEFGFLEAKELLAKTEGRQRESAQKMLAQVMQKSGEYSIPIRYMERKITRAIWDGTTSKILADEWEMAYPRGYWDKVYESSMKYGIDPFLTLAVIREESRFNPKALSHSSARGLMQIIPSTGKILANRLDIGPFKRSMMFSSEKNIEMGTFYLSDLIRRFKGNIPLALAGYNGGPVRVKKWVDNWYNGDMINLDVDDFIQNIPLTETRNYVQKVMGSYYEYKRIYNGRRG